MKSKGARWYFTTGPKETRMEMALDLMTLINLIFCIIILALGITGYTRSKEMWPLFIGIAFGLFGVSHLLTLLGLKEALATLLIAIRIIAYLFVIFTLYWLGCRQYITASDI